MMLNEDGATVSTIASQCRGAKVPNMCSEGGRGKEKNRNTHSADEQLVSYKRGRAETDAPSTAAMTTRSMAVSVAVVTLSGDRSVRPPFGRRNGGRTSGIRL